MVETPLMFTIYFSGRAGSSGPTDKPMAGKSRPRDAVIRSQRRLEHIYLILFAETGRAVGPNRRFYDGSLRLC